MTDFLLELRSEEIPARMQAKARDDLARLFAAELAGAGLTATKTVTYATPRRLALIMRGLPEVTASVVEDVKGPPADAPDPAVEGFLRKLGLSRDALQTRDVKGRATLFAVVSRQGRPTAQVLAEAVPAIIRQFPWPKAMRWGAPSASTESPRWVRPLHGIVALFGDAIIDCEVAGVRSGAVTKGHRFHHPGDITIGGAHDYVEKLKACHVIVDQDERAAFIAREATTLTAAAGLTLVRDDGLLAENAGLTEWPVPLLGRFDAGFLDVPPEVIQLTARVNQKYFVCLDGAGPHAKLANAFVCVANIAAADGGAKIVEGNRKVLAARLADARFFYDTDLKTKLEDLTPKLEKIVFHEKLGTVADKVERVAKLARWLVEEGIVPGADPDQAERAARLAKADLVTGMVGEFPELQGVMGGYYAAAQGEGPEVAAAIRDHYKPVGQGDEVPTAPVTVAVSLADKLDTLVGFFFVAEYPTGSKDPFALRRAALAVIRLLTANSLKLAIVFAVGKAVAPFQNVFNTAEAGLGDEQAGIIETLLLEFFADRLKVQQREAGVRHDLIDAVFAAKNPNGAGEDDLVRLLARVRALQAFVGTDDGANLLAGYKRAANILKKEGWTPLPLGEGQGAPGSHESNTFMGPSAPRGEGGSVSPSPDLAALGHPLPMGEGRKPLPYTPEPAEAALIAALDAAEPAAADAVANEDFEAAMIALATLRAPIDAFFDSVTVNDPDPARRAARLALLARVRAAVHTVADFGKIEG